MITRFLFICGILLLITSVAFGEGSYQRAKDDKTMVWNNDPKPGDEATWSGERDREGYATGFGTLTWYRGQKEPVRRLGIPIPLTGGSKIYARYFGNMARGKFNGPVNVHSNGKTGHAVFVDGEPTTRWATGPVSSWRVAQQPTAPAKPQAAPEPQAPAEKSPAVTKAESVKPPTNAPPARSATPARSNLESFRKEAAQPRIENTPTAETPVQAGPAPPNNQPKGGVDDSLQTLVGPPSSLRVSREPASSPETGPRLTKEEVTDLADAEVRTRGYDPAEYQRPDAQYNAADEVWSLLYDQIPSDPTADDGKHFNVIIDDKTKGTVFVPGK